MNFTNKIQTCMRDDQQMARAVLPSVGELECLDTLTQVQDGELLLLLLYRIRLCETETVREYECIVFLMSYQMIITYPVGL